MSSNASDLVPKPPPYVVVFGPHANCTLDICPVELSVYGYRPSLAANTTFIALYALSAVIHTYLGIRWKQWWFMGCMLLAAASAIIGYIGRVMMYYNPFNFSAFMLQIICVTTVPVYYCAALYVTLALAVNHFSPALSRFNPRLFYSLFIPCDLVSLALQAAGGGLSTSSSGSSQVGVDLALVGLGLQVFTMLLFCGLFADYLIRYARSRGRRGDA
ncbi:6e80bec3-ca3f-4ba2-afb5-8579566786a1 [Thermothielavioides terrestris]|uniref:6e80bec3-ca3f-4ba2-afb5-8579566786a1 n=1 Tax=Thermothielavioides terrestris TaxID=2587410 RepID=A0A446BQB1_9PEZI|nr:6e80bec3-ca3f-4ba2-afb5-8579566786a1 [Thermothielavioides terrestris]